MYSVRERFPNTPFFEMPTLIDAPPCPEMRNLSLTESKLARNICLCACACQSPLIKLLLTTTKTHYGSYRVFPCFFYINKSEQKLERLHIVCSGTFSSVFFLSHSLFSLSSTSLGGLISGISAGCIKTRSGWRVFFYSHPLLAHADVTRSEKKRMNGGSQLPRAHKKQSIRRAC